MLIEPIKLTIEITLTRYYYFTLQNRMSHLKLKVIWWG